MGIDKSDEEKKRALFSISPGASSARSFVDFLTVFY